MYIAGVDEAGRGAVVGPLVVAIVAGDNETFMRLGVRDSKLLSPERRVKLYSRIVKAARCVDHVKADPATVDSYVYKGMLNMLEAQLMADLTAKCADVAEVYVDSPDPKADRFGALLASLAPVRIIAMAGADRKVPVVAAASIVAKVIRDRAVREAAARYGDPGSGYPSDPRTLNFLRHWICEVGSIPPVVRRSWHTVRRVEEDCGRRVA